jgi:acetyl esterase/lipase
MNRRYLLLALILLVSDLSAQLAKNSRWTGGLKDKYDVTLNIAYTSVDTAHALLDLYVPKDATEPRPVLIWIHGGGWGRLSKDSTSGQLIPYLSMGWVVVNVDYRLTPVALAPAAVEDCRCALQWVAANAARIKADTKRIVVSGSSAGGHLALMTGMVPPGTALDKNCPGIDVRVAAIVDFYGITDVKDLLAKSPNRKGYAVKWLGEGPDVERIATLVSPLTYVRKDLPPIIAIQGDADPTVPYSHSVRLRDALTAAGVPNELVTIPGGVHGKFTKEQNAEIERKIIAFLKQHGIMREPN